MYFRIFKRRSQIFCIIFFQMVCHKEINAEEISVIDNHALENDSQNNFINEENQDIDINEENEDIEIENIDYPLNLNSCIYEDLLCVPGLSAEQAHNIIEHREKYGSFLSIYELQAIESLHVDEIQNLKNYFFVYESPNDPRNSSTNSQPKDILIKSTLVFPNKEKQGTLGSATDHSVSIRKKSLNWDWGISAKKSSFEKFKFDYTTKRYFFNKYRSHLMYSNKSKPIKSILFGNYSIGFAEGLILNNGMAMKNPIDCIKISKMTSKIIKPYTSTNSIAFFGSALQISWKHIDLYPFISTTSLDGKVDSDRNIMNSKSNKNSLVYSTTEELKRRNSYWEYVYGLIATSSALGKNVLNGTALMFTKYSVNIFPRSSDQYNFNGDSIGSWSSFWNISWRNTFWFLEAAVTRNFSKKTIQKKKTAPAIIYGTIISITKYLDFAASQRAFSPYFISIYGSPIRQNTTAINEHGLYFAFRIKPTYKIFFDFSQDAANKLASSVATNPYSFIWRIAVNYQPNRDFSFQLINKIKNKKTVNEIDEKIIEKKSYNYKAKLSYNLTKSIKLKSEGLLNRVKNVDSPYTNGYGFFQNISWKISKFKFTTRVGYVFAETKDSQIYTFDPVMKFTSGQKSYMGQGVVAILVCEYKILDNLSFETKFSIFNKKIYKDDSNQDLPMKLEFQLCYAF